MINFYILSIGKDTSEIWCNDELMTPTVRIKKTLLINACYLFKIKETFDNAETIMDFLMLSHSMRIKIYYGEVKEIKSTLTIDGELVPQVSLALVNTNLQSHDDPDLRVNSIDLNVQ